MSEVLDIRQMLLQDGIALRQPMLIKLSPEKEIKVEVVEPTLGVRDEYLTILAVQGSDEKTATTTGSVTKAQCYLATRVIVLPGTEERVFMDTDADMLLSAEGAGKWVTEASRKAMEMMSGAKAKGNA